MHSVRGITAIAGALVAIAVAGCGLGEGESQEGLAELVVTRDHGAERLLGATLENPAESETVVRFLDREAEIETSYGGNFVSAINGISSTVEGGRSLDWYFYVNGYWSPIGAAESKVGPGDRIWWDYRDWTDAYRIPAVVGSFPEPFVHGYEGETHPVEVICPEEEVRVEGGPCELVTDALEGVGAAPETVTSLDAAGPPKDTLRVLVGSWEALRSDETAAQLEQGPGISGVFARPVRCGDGFGFEFMDDRAEVVRRDGSAGLIASVQLGEDQPTWVVTGSAGPDLDLAAQMLTEEALRDNYALATTGDGSLPLPLGADTPEADEGCA